MQPLIAQFDIPGMTAQQYDAVMVDLERAGLTAPQGRRMHMAQEVPGGWFVTDLWDNGADLEKFAAKLIPILNQNGVNPPPPRVTPAHNIVRA